MSTKHHLHLESLEKRELLAGDVKVYFQNNDLYIVGDTLANGVEVRQTSAGVYRITGAFMGGANTTISVNGTKFPSVTARGVSDDVRISLGGGGDDLDFGTGDGNVITVPHDLIISGGAGGDYLFTRDVKVGNDLLINTGSGVYDKTYVGNTTVGGELKVYDPTTIRSGDYDECTVNGSTVTERMAFVFRGGNDTVDINASSTDRVYAVLGAGDDYFKMTGTRTGRIFNVQGGNGYDRFFVPIANGLQYFGSGFEEVDND